MHCLHKLSTRTLAVLVAGYLLLFLSALHCYDRRLFQNAECSADAMQRDMYGADMNASSCHANVVVASLANDYIDGDLVTRSIRNKETYAEHWGLHVEIVAHDNFARFAWTGAEVKQAKFAFVESLLQQYKVVFWVDIDAVITRMDIDLCVLLDEMTRRDKYIAMASDASMDGVLNSGVFLIRRGVGTSAFLAEFANAHAVVEACRSSMTCPPAVYDQNVIGYLADIWPRCFNCVGLWPLAPVHANAEQFRALFYEVPRCLFNTVPETANQFTFVTHCYGGGLLDLLSPLSRRKRRGKQACMSQLLV
jgi:hypothetical protein